MIEKQKYRVKENISKNNIVAYATITTDFNKYKVIRLYYKEKIIMKKIIATVIVILMVATALAGCVQQTNVAPEISEQPEEQMATPAPTDSFAPIPIMGSIPAPTSILAPTPTLSILHEDDGDWVYYSEWGGLYRFRPDGTKKTLLLSNDDFLGDFAVLDGWIYYRNHDGLGFKMRLDGTEKTEVQGLDIRSGVTSSDGWVYYTTKGRIGEGDYDDQIYINKICRISTDGLKTEIIFESNQDNDNYYVDVIDVTDGWVYYIHSNWNESKATIYKTSTDGKETKKIFDKNESIDILEIYEDWLYFYSSDYDYDYEKETNHPGLLKKVHVNGGEPQVLMDNIYELEDIFISGEWIYLINVVPLRICGDMTESRERNIYKIKTDGTGKTKLNSDNSDNLTFYKDMIYYTVPYYGKLSEFDIDSQNQSGNYLYKIGIGGKGREKIGTFEFERDDDEPEETPIKKTRPKPNHKGLDITTLAGKNMSNIIKTLGKKYTVKKTNEADADYETYEYETLWVTITKLKKDKYPSSIEIQMLFDDDNGKRYGNDKINIKGYGLDAFENKYDMVRILGQPDYAYTRNDWYDGTDGEFICVYKLKSDVYLKFSFCSDDTTIGSVCIYQTKQ